MRDTELFRPTVTKGLTKTRHRIILFDAAQPCRESCPIYNKCPYEKAGKCRVEITYLKALTDSLLEDIGDAMDQRLLNKITLQLFPLFQQLIRLQIYAYSIENVVYETARGTPAVHPIFKEIRDTIRAIESTQRSMGMDSEFLNAFNNFYADRGYKDGMKSANPDYGDSSLLDSWQGQNRRSVFPDGERDPNLRRAKRSGRGNGGS